MKTYTIPYQEAVRHKPIHPTRTAYRVGVGNDFNRYYKIWPTRAAMLMAIRGTDYKHEYAHGGADQ